MCSITILNRYVCDDPNGIYIGRGSPLGNPYKLEDYGREKCIALYADWLDQQIRDNNPQVIDALNAIGERVLAGEDVKLVCFCKPKACHGDIIKARIMARIRETQSELIYAGIGSRATPDDMCDMMVQIGQQLAESGWMLRSGHAEGADLAFETGARKVNGKMEIFLPWPGFNRAPLKDPVFHVPVFTSELMTLAAKHHPNWAKCTDAHKRLHARNGCQIMGLDLRTPVRMVICWTDKGFGSGGTGQAIRIANSMNIPVFDLAIPNRWRALIDFVNQVENKKAA